MRKDIAVLEKLVKVNSKALAYAAAVESVKLAKADLDAVYGFWKVGSGIDYFIEKDSAEWDEMMLDTKPFYRALVNAKARERRAKLALLKSVEVS